MTQQVSSVKLGPQGSVLQRLSKALLSYTPCFMLLLSWAVI